jgi:hypothetical protein
MKLFHSTSAAAAEAILANGFKDDVGNYLTLREWKEGVWLSDRQRDANEGAIAEALLIVEIDGRLIRSYEWVEDGDKGYRDWLIPAEVLNHCAKICEGIRTLGYPRRCRKKPV